MNDHHEPLSTRSLRLTLLIGVLFAALMPAIVDAESADDCCESSSAFLGGETVDVGLGKTARIEWGSLDDPPTVVIRGEEDRDLSVLLRLRARFGPIELPLLEERIDVPAGTVVERAVDPGAAAGLHPKQMSYATLIGGRATVIWPSGQLGAAQRLDDRFLVMMPGERKLAVVDAERLERNYPGGVTSAALRAELKAVEARLLALGPDEDEDEGADLGVEPGISVGHPRAELDSRARVQAGRVLPAEDSLLVTKDVLPPGSVSTRFCIEYSPEFEDVEGRDDWWTSNSNKTARGVRVRVRDTSTGNSPFYGYAGRNSGCTPFIGLDTSRQYQIRVYSQAKVSPGAVNMIDVRNASDQRYFKTLVSSYSPAAGTEVLTWNNASNSVVNIMAAAGYSVNKRYGGLSGETFTIFNDECSYGGSCAKEEGGGTVYLSENGRVRKYIIAHEIGHVVGIKVNEGKRAKMGALHCQPICQRVGSGCPKNHVMTSKEYQGKAAHEGFAHFYAATVWNDPSENGCAFAYYINYDFDRDGTVEGWEYKPWVSCRASWPDQDEHGVPDADFLHNVCANVYSNRGTQYDWLRALWNLHNNDGVSYGAISRIWDNADPHTWNEKGGGVYEALDAAADVELNASDYAEWQELLDIHGLDQ